MLRFVGVFQVASFKKCLVASIRYEWSGSQCLADDDPEVMAIVRKEKARQKMGLELIASEVLYLWNFLSEMCADKWQILSVFFSVVLQ